MPPAPDEPGEYRPPPYHLTTWLVLGGALVLVLGLFAVRSDYNPDEGRVYASRTLPLDSKPVLLPPPPPSDEYLPCEDCHSEEPANAERRELEDEHDETGLNHGDLWCLHCHDLEQKQMLQLADRTLVTFDESWRLCTQCHGKKLADWRAGVHGKRTGHWWGEKEYRTCVECHNPHNPPFEALEPEPPPVRPDQIVWKANTAGEASREEP